MPGRFRAAYLMGRAPRQGRLGKPGLVGQGSKSAQSRPPPPHEAGLKLLSIPRGVQIHGEPVATEASRPDVLPSPAFASGPTTKPVGPVGQNTLTDCKTQPRAPCSLGLTMSVERQASDGHESQRHPVKRLAAPRMPRDT